MLFFPLDVVRLTFVKVGVSGCGTQGGEKKDRHRELTHLKLLGFSYHLRRPIFADNLQTIRATGRLTTPMTILYTSHLHYGIALMLP